MGVTRDAAGRRSVRAETEVPGTPEEVWRAVATGPGISCWFVPSEVEERVGGRVTCRFGPGMESQATITEWEPPRRFAGESADLGGEAPRLLTEWSVEPLGAEGCRVRVVHSLASEPADTESAESAEGADDLDSYLEAIEAGWPDFFRILRLYLTHFRGREGAAVQVMGGTPEAVPEAWRALTEPLGLAGAAAGERRCSPQGAPRLEGIVETASHDPQSPQIVLRLEEPAPGLAHLFALPMDGLVLLPVRLYLYGEGAERAASLAEPAWRAWLGERFPVD